MHGQWRFNSTINHFFLFFPLMSFAICIYWSELTWIFQQTWVYNWLIHVFLARADRIIKCERNECSSFRIDFYGFLRIEYYIVRITRIIQVDLIQSIFYTSIGSIQWVVCITTFLLSYLNFLHFLISNFSSTSLGKLLKLSEMDAGTFRKLENHSLIWKYRITKSRKNLESKSLRT
jgi:hypothetical protein